MPLIPAICLLSRSVPSSPLQALGYFRCYVDKLCVATWEVEDLGNLESWNNGCPEETGATPPGGERGGSSCEYTALFVLSTFVRCSGGNTSACWTDKMSSYPLGAFEIKGKIKYCVCKEIKAVGQDTVSLWVLPAWRRTWRLACVGTPVSSWFLSLLRFYGQTNELKYPHRDIAMRKFPDPEGTIEECAIQISLHILIIWFNFLLWNVSRTHTHAHTQGIE